MTRMDVKTWRKSHNGKAYTVRIGSSWTDDKGTIRLNFDALPLPDDKGQVSCFLEAPRDREEAPAQSNSARARAAAGGGRPSGQLDDDIPFEMEWR